MNKMPQNWRIVQPDQPAKPTSPKRKKDPHRKRTLRRTFRRILRPRMEAELAKKSSFAPYSTALNLWESYWLQRSDRRRAKLAIAEGQRASVHMTEAQKTPGKRRVADPPVHRITKEHLASFRRWLMADGNRKSITVNNHMRSISTLLRAADDEDWIVSRQPKLKRLKSKKAAPKVVMTMDQVADLYKACDRASWPKVDREGNTIDTAAHWRAAVVLFCCFGFRTQELLRYQSWKRSLTWENLHWQSESPGTSTATTSCGWLSYVPEKQEGMKPEPLVLALPEIVMLHLRSLSSNSATLPASGTIFNWPWSRRSLGLTWTAVCRAGGVTPKRGTGVHRFCVKHFRKTATTWHNLQAPSIAPWIVGHSERTQSVSDLHYNNPEHATTSHLQGWRYPEVFDDIRETGQMKLF
jgi:hypothetical protein